jgi:hypothetical protein
VTSKDEDAEMARLLEMTEEELRAHIAAQGLDWNTEVARLKSIYQDAPMELMERALFGATLDDIMNLSEFADLDIRPVGFLRQDQKAKSTPVGRARSRRDDTTRADHDASAQASELVMPSHTTRKKR